MPAPAPRIGISSDIECAADADPPREQTCLLTAYTDSIFAAGGLPCPLPVPGEWDDHRIDFLLDQIDGLMLTGGFDLHPHHYTTDPQHPASTLLPEHRDRFEWDLCRRADQRRIPILAICLGMQFLHVLRGGRLIQHLGDLDSTPAITHRLTHSRNAFHPVSIAPGSHLADVLGTTTLEVSSRHHQAVDPAHQGRNLQPVAWAPDGVLEASEDCVGRFLLAVQWHPEDLIDRPEHLQLFKALVAASRH